MWMDSLKFGSQGWQSSITNDCTLQLQEWNLVGWKEHAAQSKRPSGILVGQESCGGASEYRINLVNYKVR